MALTGAGLDSPNETQSRDEQPGAERSLRAVPMDHVSALFSNTTSCLAKIAIMLQYAPYRMLSFRQLKNKLTEVFNDQRLAENSIRWYLSGYRCFVRIQSMLSSKLWYWRLDSSHITAEMVSEHFLELLHLFPDLASRLENENPSRPTGPLCSLEPAPCWALNITPEVRFTGPFSIDSILKRDNTSAQAYRASPPSSLPVRVEHPLYPTPGTKRCFSWHSNGLFTLPASAGSSPVCTGGGRTHHGAIADGAAKPFKRMLVYPPPLFPLCPTVSPAPLFTSPQAHGIAYTIPAFTHNALHF